MSTDAIVGIACGGFVYLGIAAMLIAADVLEWNNKPMPTDMRVAIATFWPPVMVVGLVALLGYGAWLWLENMGRFAMRAVPKRAPRVETKPLTDPVLEAAQREVDAIAPEDNS